MWIWNVIFWGGVAYVGSQFLYVFALGFVTLWRALGLAAF